MEIPHYDVDTFIDTYGLTYGAQRDVSLFASSSVVQGYTVYLQRFFGFAYNAYGAVFHKDVYTSLVNNIFVGKKTEEVILNHTGSIFDLFKPALELYQLTREQHEWLKNDTIDDIGVLRQLCILYPQAVGALSVYNCFFRLSNEQIMRLLTTEEIASIGEERNMVACLYPELEKTLVQCVRGIGKEMGVDGELLTYFLLSEMETFLLGCRLTNNMRLTLERRRQGYVHLYLTDRKEELVITDSEVVDQVYHSICSTPDGQYTLKGVCAYEGIVRGIVYNLTESLQQVVPDGCILVARHTQPSLTSYIMKASALVVDEGGLLSHAAIIAREAKKPTIIGTQNGTIRLKTGDVVEIDAEKGIINILNKT